MKRVLILDDEPDIVTIIILILTDAGYNTEGIGTGAELFTKVAQFKPDLIILDVMLGEYDGRKLCVELKSSLHTQHIPILMISASHNLLGMQEKYCVPDDFMDKPFDIYELAAKVKDLLDKNDH